MFKIDCFFSGTTKLEVIKKTIHNLDISIDTATNTQECSIVSTRPSTSMVSSLLAKHVKSFKSVSTLEDELQRFSNVTSNEESILQFWKSNEKDFPKLGKIAKTLLAIPMSSAKSESAFSTAGSLIRKDRASLMPYRIEKTLFIHDNYDILNM